MQFASQPNPTAKPPFLNDPAYSPKKPLVRRTPGASTCLVRPGLAINPRVQLVQQARLMRASASRMMRRRHPGARRSCSDSTNTTMRPASSWSSSHDSSSAYRPVPMRMVPGSSCMRACAHLDWLAPAHTAARAHPRSARGGACAVQVRVHARVERVGQPRTVRAVGPLGDVLPRVGHGLVVAGAVDARVQFVEDVVPVVAGRGGGRARGGGLPVCVGRVIGAGGGGGGRGVVGVADAALVVVHVDFGLF
jgi:hypothetical protein